MNPVILIPARYASTRFPGKPLALLGGHPIIEHVWRRASAVCTATYVATDDERIADAVRGFGGNVIMTRADHRSGTDRIGEAVSLLGDAYDVAVNVQGDEPFIEAEQIKTLIAQFEAPEVDIATLSTPCQSPAEVKDPNVVKVVAGATGNALYFSRHPVPYQRGVEKEEWFEHFPYQKHVGIYAYRTSVLKQVVTLSPSSLEKAESLEQLRWLDAGYCIRVVPTRHCTIGIDTPADLEAAERILKGGNLG